MIGAILLAISAVLGLPLARSLTRPLDEENRTLRSREHAGIVRAWNHTLHIEPVDERRCRYSDTVEIDAGRSMSIVARAAVGIYRYRQRRWRHLVAKHLLLDGPSYGKAA